MEKATTTHHLHVCLANRRSVASWLEVCTYQSLTATRCLHALCVLPQSQAVWGEAVGVKLFQTIRGFYDLIEEADSSLMQMEVV